MNDKVMQLRAYGENINPASIRAGEVAAIMEALESLIASIVQKTHPGLEKDDLVLALVEIEDKSLDLNFVAELHEVVSPAFSEAANAIHTNRPDSLPRDCMDPLQVMVSFAKRHSAQFDFIVKNGSSITLATLTSDFVIPQPIHIKGETTIYGEINRVGGVDPIVVFKTISGKTLHCPFDKKLASQLGSRLYQMAGLRGEAKWDSDTFELKDFKVIEVTPYEDTSITQAMQELSTLTARYYEDIDDVDGYIAKLRGEE